MTERFAAALESVDPRSRLDATRRKADLATLADDPAVDVLVIGGGVTGTGVALDAASRGLSVALVDKHDLAFGTSRWSSKLVHGGLRYLASGAVGIAHESAVERDVLIRSIAPHLTRPLAQVVPLLADVSTFDAALTRVGFLAGDVLRRAAGTPATELGRSRRISAAEVIRMAPTVKRAGLRGGLLNWDGQLTDDARLTVAIARTAAAHGARILTHCAASQVTGTAATVTDELTGASRAIRARAVINATGVWAGTVDPAIALRPSRGTHLVFRQDVFGGLTAGLTVPVPGAFGRYVFALPQPDGRIYVGLTDEEADGPLPDVPTASEEEIDFLLATVSLALDTPLRRDHIAGTFAGLRPLLDSGAGRTADVSRKHAVLTRGDGLITVVGGKLTTYRRMAQDAVDAAVTASGLLTGPSVTRSVPLVGAAPRGELAAVAAPQRLVHKYGTEATAVAALAEVQPALAEPVTAGTEITGAEMLYGALVEGALTVDDLLERRTRLSLIPHVAAAATSSAEAALAAQ
ncbi:Glycerol-3-phosphate dehydrogenase OS=Tsukamurella paurometabola (strain ATCC 8368 / DSM / CCUG 35730 / CIP 100753 / JCM 10117 / KCTC 9821 / NBRC 16120/ NCIMB 702349 / NCTC 13040) OX=521096 GN=Tpau_1956 PE=3 SV=1 [Tsukamurella paurometabola]|uniref:Glycerol-3-phosphate dehydrogenase n=1 Tax=Tsukamurella paurometabola (strain ATCC 8368 / DSM 20162 / CCUG 35730 / CIP 100753 / JCM 10117 / KCTC 9821 / NBRC 16120 / NCIMB 702349 / NCTC 13040) TaxID=521096 RepID=D5UNK0_TSUPD|nr:glycerol-3-phosphate dehydrogenase/oxidase [Tsukamurella paurometabola]ADG78568.1 FAD dependent oxidoreductase [Tsukamurella paurometabola DSM 20162]SUP32220.1 Aerobic glycerol-3-phosphate dehydrogenase [Tsukamurella paurometabola]